MRRILLTPTVQSYQRKAVAKLITQGLLRHERDFPKLAMMRPPPPPREGGSGSQQEAV